ncbi:unnamed protein product [Parnassius mnemosyne]|uniref:Transposase n=1 Tax=Parnassius mnemosyne TaxID=213953 RepID=A0AAV1KKE5_9NEOP
MPGSRRHMDVETETRAVFMLQEGESQRSVARRLAVSRRAIRNAWERFLETGSVARRSGSGRARATTVQEDRRVESVRFPPASYKIDCGNRVAHELVIKPFEMGSM